MNGGGDISALEERAEQVAARLAVLANPKRLLILCELAKGECSVGDLLARIDLSQSALSQHLSKMRGDGAVVTRREGQTIFYRIEDPQTLTLMSALYETFCKDA